MIERKPAYGMTAVMYNTEFRQICLESDLREVEEQRDRLLGWILGNISHGPDIYGKDWKEFYKDDLNNLKSITGLSWEELKGGN